LYDYRQQNAAVVRQSGFDFTPKFAYAMDTHTITTQLNLSFIDKIDTAFATNASSTNLVNTFGQPTRWRGRLDVAWASPHWAFGGALNAVGHYVNNVGLGTPAVASWITLDLNAMIYPGTYFQSLVWQGTSLSLSGLNVLNREPPYVSASGLGVAVTYDPANANPLGRFVSIELKKRW
jgi:hypothetical protein